MTTHTVTVHARWFGRRGRVHWPRLWRLCDAMASSAARELGAELDQVVMLDAQLEHRPRGGRRARCTVVARVVLRAA